MASMSIFNEHATGETRANDDGLCKGLNEVCRLSPCGEGTQAVTVDKASTGCVPELVCWEHQPDTGRPQWRPMQPC